MKNFLMTFMGVLLLFGQVKGQQVITVQSGLDATTWVALDSAIAHAVDGDHIYIPGGSYNINILSVDKSVFIFGAGHYPDSTVATGPTVLMGDVLLITGASGGMITGCSISGNIRIGNGQAGSDSVSNFTVSRNIFQNLYLSYTGFPPTHVHTVAINENVIRGSIYGANAVGAYFSKNIIEKSIRNFGGNCVFENNDFIGLGNCSNMENFLVDVSVCTFINNIILYSPPACSTAAFFGGTCLNNVFTNNLFTYGIVFPQGTNTGFNSIVGQPIPTVFVAAVGDTFTYTENYNLKLTSPASLGATDGRDVGITGTSQPYKKSAMPLNPHIQMKSIDGSTNSQGQLNIQVKVAAQDN